MRHLWSLIAGIVIAPLAWAGLALGQVGASATATKWGQANAFDTADLIQPAAYLVSAGVLLGLIGTLRISPAGPLAVAVVYLGLGAGMFVDPFAVRDAVPNNIKVIGETIPLRAPLLNGTLVAVGALLLIAAFSAKRWRRWPTGEAAGAGSGTAGQTEPTAVLDTTDATELLPARAGWSPAVAGINPPDTAEATTRLPRHSNPSGLSGSADEAVTQPTPTPTSPAPAAGSGGTGPGGSPWSAPPPRAPEQ